MTSSTITTIPSSFECYTCEINFISSTLPFTLYQCNTCNEKTPFCANCIPIITKLFGNIIFKCKFCNTIDKAITKEEIIRQSQNCCSIFAHNSHKTPLKSSLISNNNQQTNTITFQSSASTTNLPLFMNEEQKTNFNDDFTNKLIVSNISSSNNSSDTPMMPFSGNEAFISKYTLLSKKKQGTNSTLKKFILNSACNNNNNSSIISENQNNSFCDSEFAGYNKKMKRTPMLTKSKYLMQQCHNKSMNENGINISTCSINNNNNSMINITNNNNDSSNNTISSPFSSSALQKLSFSNNVDEFGNRKNMAGFGMRCQLGGSYNNNGNIDTPHKFNINLNLTPSSFQINPM